MKKIIENYKQLILELEEILHKYDKEFKIRDLNVGRNSYDIYTSSSTGFPVIQYNILIKKCFFLLNAKATGNRDNDKLLLNEIKNYIDNSINKQINHG